MADYAVFIGRFQPVHAGHIHVAKRALTKHTNLLICIGSSNRGRRTDNPFTYQERVDMWVDELYHQKIDRNRVQFIDIDDMFYQDLEWISQVRFRVNQRISGDCTVALVGHEKDHTSYYLKFFPEWESDLLKTGHDNLSSTRIREFFYSKLLNQTTYLSQDSYYGNDSLKGLSQWSAIWTDPYQKILNDLAFEWHFDKGYDPSKYPVIVSTVDSVVVQNGHVLVVRRKNRPGKGLFALPGGHIERDETLESAMLRELREETQIDRSNRVLRSNIKKHEIFDYPYRSTRARVITTAYLIHLPDEAKLAKVKGGDDAEEAFWMPLSEVRYKDFFEDHAAIIERMTAGL